MQSAIDQTDFSFPDQTKVYHGKVRDVYTINKDQYLVAVATDRISAFDVILPRAIPGKGQVLNQLAAYFLEATKDLVPNWLLSTPDPNVAIGHKCKVFRIEMIVRGSLVGSAWRNYQAGGREICGIKLPDGMKEYDRFPSPIITPTTKADEGHDADISGEDIVSQGLATAEEWQELQDNTLKLFARGQEMAAARGLELVDTKYEFGKRGGQIYVIDEIHTPDSSRYFYKDSYDAYLKGETKQTPKHLSKEFVREWLMDNGFSGQTGQSVPKMTDEFVQSVTDRYIELYQELTGKTFKPTDDADPLRRIETNVKKTLKQLL